MSHKEKFLQNPDEPKAFLMNSPSENLISGAIALICMPIMRNHPIDLPEMAMQGEGLPPQILAQTDYSSLTLLLEDHLKVLKVSCIIIVFSTPSTIVTSIINPIQLQTPSETVFGVVFWALNTFSEAEAIWRETITN